MELSTIERTTAIISNESKRTGREGWKEMKNGNGDSSPADFVSIMFLRVNKAV